MLERLGLPDAGERIADDCLDEIQDPQGGPPVRLHPVAEIVPKLGLKDRLAWSRARA
jgi:hypothetical protein